MADNYQDIINNPHYTSKTRKRMSQINRAAQFAPFAALAGYDAAISETSRLTDMQTELDERAKETLNIKLNLIKEHIKEHPTVTITYFVPDSKKDGGAYIDYTGNVRVFDEYGQAIIMTDRTKISIGQICFVQSELFNILN